jgi:hypothetical protein
MSFDTFFEIKNIINKTKVSELKDLLNLDDNEEIYKASHIYNRIDKTNYVDKHMRSSRKIEYRDHKIFDWIEKNIVEKINENESIEERHKYILIRNVEVVKYESGDFFKKHQDYINFDSNQFKNYTFLLCINACQKGGETVLHIDGKEHVFDSTCKSPGSILALKKDTIHEGREILEGNKVILKGNLICFEKNITKEELIIVNIVQSNGHYYILPVDMLQKYDNNPYLLAYNFNKKINPKDNVYYYEEKELTDSDFRYFYDKVVFDIRNYANLSKKLEYIGYTEKNNMLLDFNNMINNDDIKLMYTSITNYYKLLGSINYYPDILPFQLITFASQKENLVVWCGFYDNKFAACDYYVGMHCTNDDDFNIEHYDNKTDKNNYKYIDLCLEKHFSKLNERSKIKKVKKFMIKQGVDFWPEQLMTHILDNKNHEMYNNVHKYLFEKYGLTEMKDITFSKSNDPNEQMNRYVLKLIDDLSSQTESDSDPDGQPSITDENKKNYVYVDESKHIPIDSCDIDREKIKVNDKLCKININKVIKRIESEKFVSKLDSGNMSEYMCNETYYLTYTVVYKFGFMKITDDLFGEDISVDDKVDDPDIKIV